MRAGLYTHYKASVYVRVIKVQYECPEYIKAKVCFEYKNGLTFETRNVILKPENIKHWIRVPDKRF